MPTPTYTPLANLTLGSTASSVTFGSIPATYRDLIVVWNGTVTASGAQLRFNGDSTSNYSYVSMQGSASGAQSFSGTISFALTTMTGYVSGNRGQVIAQIMDYSATDKHKTVLARHDGNNAAETTATASRWANTAAITSVVVVNTGGNFNSGSTFSLYGVIA
jgi:hypothetical protein